MENSQIFLIIAGVVIALAILIMFSSKGKSLGKLISEARKTGDIKPIVEAIEADKTGDQPTSYNVAIKTLWDGYERELAMGLIRELLERYDTTPIAQKWLQDALGVEPELARKVMGKDFIDAHFHEAIAQGCAGCGGSCKSCK